MKIDIDYCIVNNSSIANNNYVVFLSKKDSNEIDYNLKKEDDYQKAKDILKTIGFYEVDDLKFEYLGNEKERSWEDIKNTLEQHGASYNEILEKEVVQELKNINKVSESNLLNKLLNKINFGSNNKEDKKLEKSNNDNNKIQVINNDKNKEENFEIINNDVISLNLYLFLEFIFLNEENEKGKNFIVDLVGSFTSKQQTTDNSYRHFVKIITLDFKKLNSQEKRANGIDENLVVYESVKTKKEILEEISFLFDVFFNVASFDDEEEDEQSDEDYILFPETEEHFYNIMDIKDYIDQKGRIVFHFEEKDFNKLKQLSDRIGIEKSETQKAKRISKEEISLVSKELIEHIREKMNHFAEEEDFKSASQMKKRIKYVEQKVNDFLNNKDENDMISLDEFHTKFAINTDL